MLVVLMKLMLVFSEWLISWFVLFCCSWLILFYSLLVLLKVIVLRYSCEMNRLVWLNCLYCMCGIFLLEKMFVEYVF